MAAVLLSIFPFFFAYLVPLFLRLISSVQFHCSRVGENTLTQFTHFQKPNLMFFRSLGITLVLVSLILAFKQC